MNEILRMKTLAGEYWYAEYGIYTIGDANFFAGIVASVNALRYYGYEGPVAVLDIGFMPWMVQYLGTFRDVIVLDMQRVQRGIRFTDVADTENPVMKGWAYKAFGMLYYNLFRHWTFIDGDYLPLCNLESHLRPLAERGKFVSTEDGSNTWEHEHEEATGVKPGTYMNINAGFISMSMDKYGYILHEWRNLMTRKKPFDLWYGDQGALNAILDKWGVEKTILDKVLWNQTWLNQKMADEGLCSLKDVTDNKHVWYPPKKSRIFGWHGSGRHKLWHQLGIDYSSFNDPAERGRFFAESEGKSPRAIVDIFNYFLFLGRFSKPLRKEAHQILPPL